MSGEHLAMAIMRRYVDAILTRDWKALADTIAEDHRFEDRRLGMKSTLDKAGNIEQARVMADLGAGSDESIDFSIVETRGERHALVRQVYRASGYAVPFLAVIELDADGRSLNFIVFDESDVEGARAELEAMTTRSD